MSDCELRGSAERRELELTRAQVAQARQEVQQLQALLATREQEHVRALAECRRALLAGPEMQQAREQEAARTRDSCHHEADLLQEKCSRLQALIFPASGLLALMNKLLT